MRRTTIPMLLIALTLVACTTTPGAEALPDKETVRDRVRTPAPLPGPADAPPRHPIVYEALEYKGVRGGRITFDTEGRPEEVLAMLLDFEHAKGHRAWAKTYESLPAVEGRPRARWNFEGHMGINPSVILEFDIRHEAGDAIVVRYKLVKTAFGLGAFFGDYRIEPIAGARRSRLTERVFIDSGTWLANASKKDVEDGLREDARLIQAWMKERTSRASQSDSP
ncbi:MAG TPA: hypothetical protein ENK43_11375 [Planctomycetes bacterium]|nr:hypothetical protein [Planctomycetota bacterium]